MHRLKTFLLAVAAAAGALAAAGSAMAGGAVYTLTNAAPNNAVCGRSASPRTTTSSTC
jgi:hypothetical protein